MIVRTLEDIEQSDRNVHGHTFKSRRFLLKKDDTSFSFHDTVLYAGTTTVMWYKNHVEAVYCIEGKGRLTDRETGEVYDIAPGTMYCLDQHDRHTLEAIEDLRMICVFTPPLTGKETHDEDGAYPLLDE